MLSHPALTKILESTTPIARLPHNPGNCPVYVRILHIQFHLSDLLVRLFDYGKMKNIYNKICCRCDLSAISGRNCAIRCDLIATDS